jgi:dihydroorotate dehydrogenase electron transfer subunit
MVCFGGNVYMPLQNICKITKTQQLAEEIYLVTADMGQIALQAKPGQFVHVLCSEANLLRRPISICDVSGSELTMVFEVKGEGTKWLAARKPGDEIDVLGPLGHGFDVSGSNIIVSGGGIGVPPMLYAAKSCSGSATAVLGFRDSSRVILENEFKSACNETVVASDDGSYGVQGPVTLPIEKLLKTGKYDAVLCCGPRPMLKAISQLCEKYGVVCQVSMEERMGCGIGACLVCACKTQKEGQEHMSRVCKDGPVFDSREVVW